jgi:hypothetical protein
MGGGHRARKVRVSRSQAGKGAAEIEHRTASNERAWGGDQAHGRRVMSTWAAAIEHMGDGHQARMEQVSWAPAGAGTGAAGNDRMGKHVWSGYRGHRRGQGWGAADNERVGRQIASAWAADSERVGGG